MSETEQLWSGEFGDQYTARNRVRYLDRVPFWHSIIAKTGIESALEVGCNIGSNLLAMRVVNPYMTLRGSDLNETALRQASACGLTVYCGNLVDHGISEVDAMTFTVGCLIHVPPADIMATMEAIADHSQRYVLAVEYAAETETEIEYRGQMGLLWKRPYGEYYKRLGLMLVETGDAGEGFDKCTYWLMRK